jgi:uncharacterized protein (TIGR02246 family)
MEIPLKYLLTASLWFFLASTSNVVAQSKADEEAASKLPQEFCDAWAKHDGHALAQIMDQDVDFVTVATTYLHGRPDFELFHVRLLSGRFKDSTITALKTTTRFLRSDMAVVHWSWKIEGDKNPDGTPRQPRYGMMTLVAEKKTEIGWSLWARTPMRCLAFPLNFKTSRRPLRFPELPPDASYRHATAGEPFASGGLWTARQRKRPNSW